MSHGITLVRQLNYIVEHIAEQIATCKQFFDNGKKICCKTVLCDLLDQLEALLEQPADLSGLISKSCIVMRLRKFCKQLQERIRNRLHQNLNLANQEKLQMSLALITIGRVELVLDKTSDDFLLHNPDYDTDDKTSTSLHNMACRAINDRKFKIQPRLRAALENKFAMEMLLTLVPLMEFVASETTQRAVSMTQSPDFEPMTKLWKGKVCASRKVPEGTLLAYFQIVKIVLYVRRWDDLYVQASFCYPEFDKIQCAPLCTLQQLLEQAPGIPDNVTSNTNLQLMLYNPHLYVVHFCTAALPNLLAHAAFCPPGVAYSHNFNVRMAANQYGVRCLLAGEPLHPNQRLFLPTEDGGLQSPLLANQDTDKAKTKRSKKKK